MKTITPAALQELIAANNAPSIIDVRTPVEFAEAHVPQATNEPLDQLRPAALAGVQRDTPVYLLCRSGKRAEAAAEKFARDGFADPIVVTGGTLAWIDAGLPVDRGAVKVMSLERQVRIAAGSLVFIGVLLGYFASPWFYILPGFVGAGLVFAGITDFCGMGLLLARLPWNSRKPA